MNRTSDCRHPARLLLPWAVTDRLEGDDAHQFRNHVANCMSCRAELETERRLVASLNADDNVEYAPAASLQKFMRRLDQADAVESSAPAPAAPQSRTVVPVARARRWLSRRPLLLTVTAMQTAAIVLLGILVARPFAPAAYTTVADPTPVPDGPALRVLFAAELPVGELPDLLGRVGAEITAGPSASGVYTLEVRPGHTRDAALSALRSDTRVRFAEPVLDAGRASSP